MDEQQTQTADTELEELFSDEESQEDVEPKSDNLSLEELNTLAGRTDNPFKSKEEYLKHYEGLKKLSGDQEAIKERKAQKEVEELKKKDSDVSAQLENFKKEIAKKDFLIETPTAKNYIDVIEAYAEKNNMSIDEAWKSEKFKPIAETAERVSKNIITNNRITPIQSQKMDKIAEQVRVTGNDSAKIDLVKEYFKK